MAESLEPVSSFLASIVIKEPGTRSELGRLAHEVKANNNRVIYSGKAKLDTNLDGGRRREGERDTDIVLFDLPKARSE